jgi:hypothetical protein
VLLLPFVAVGPGADACLVALCVGQHPEGPGERIVHEASADGQGGAHPGLGLVMSHREVKMHPVALRPGASICWNQMAGSCPAGSAMDNSIRSGRMSNRRWPSASWPLAATAAAATSLPCASDCTGTETASVPSRYRHPISATAAEAAVRDSGAPGSVSDIQPECQKAIFLERTEATLARSPLPGQPVTAAVWKPARPSPSDCGMGMVAGGRSTGGDDDDQG